SIGAVIETTTPLPVLLPVLLLVLLGGRAEAPSFALRLRLELALVLRGEVLLPLRPETVELGGFSDERCRHEALRRRVALRARRRRRAVPRHHLEGMAALRALEVVHRHGRDYSKCGWGLFDYSTSTSTAVVLSRPPS